jgi:hypothetical protein
MILGSRRIRSMGRRRAFFDHIWEDGANTSTTGFTLRQLDETRLERIFEHAVSDRLHFGGIDRLRLGIPSLIDGRFGKAALRHCDAIFTTIFKSGIFDPGHSWISKHQFGVLEPMSKTRPAQTPYQVDIENRKCCAPPSPARRASSPPRHRCSAAPRRPARTLSRRSTAPSRTRWSRASRRAVRLLSPFPPSLSCPAKGAALIWSFRS